ncbi:hypothetical protein ONZ45_g7612 [Pleurotus djamor]|nr:hypothetical protein ONZ45_g7612 [Pleurotus djamor]
MSDSASTLFRSFARTLSPLLLGAVVTFPLFGIAVAQTAFYFRTYHTDHISVKGCVIAILILDAIHTVCVTHTVKSVYLRGVVSLAEPLYVLPFSLLNALIISPSHKSLSNIPLLLGTESRFNNCLLISTVHQSIQQRHSFKRRVFTYRVWRLSKSKIIIATLLGLISIQFGSGMNMAKGQINAEASDNISDTEHKVSGMLELISAILCDILISASLVHFLRFSRTGVRRTEKMIDLLIIYAIGIGSLTVLANIILAPYEIYSV